MLRTLFLLQSDVRPICLAQLGAILSLFGAIYLPFGKCDMLSLRKSVL